MFWVSEGLLAQVITWYTYSDYQRSKKGPANISINSIIINKRGLNKIIIIINIKHFNSVLGFWVLTVCSLSFMRLDIWWPSSKSLLGKSPLDQYGCSIYTLLDKRPYLRNTYDMMDFFFVYCFLKEQF